MKAYRQLLLILLMLMPMFALAQDREADYQTTYDAPTYQAFAQAFVENEAIRIAVHIAYQAADDRTIAAYEVSLDEQPCGRLVLASTEEKKRLLNFEGTFPTQNTSDIGLTPVYQETGPCYEESFLMTLPLKYEVQREEADVPQVTITGRLHSDMPEAVIVLTNIGREMKDGLDMQVHQAAISIPETGFTQTLTYRSRETVNSLYPALLADLNFDGYLDLDLTVGMGASNRFSVFSLWQPEQGCFAQVNQDLELCNYSLLPERKDIRVYIHESALHHDIIRYHWENGMLAKKAMGSVYSSYPSGDVYESAKLIASDGSEKVLWDDHYQPDWYDTSRVYQERDAVLEQVIYLNALEEAPKTAVIVNADWVNLRHRDTKSSSSIGKIDAGETVQVLAEKCGEDQGWVRVLWEGKTGYIWHTFLK